MKPTLSNGTKCAIASATLALSLLAPMTAAIGQVRFVAPPVRAPGNREAGASRSNTCVPFAEGQVLTALIPETNIGLTTQPFPTLFAHVPANNAEGAELRLYEEESGEEVYASQIALPAAAAASDYHNRSALLRLAAPTTSPVTLEPGKDYIWALMLVCNAEDRADDITIAGVVRRVDEVYLSTLPTEVRDRLSNVDADTAEASLTAYGEAGVWYELLETLAALAREDPNAYQNDWMTLLEQQGLEETTGSPVVFDDVQPVPLTP